MYKGKYCAVIGC